jgi:hypothetical protein
MPQVTVQRPFCEFNLRDELLRVEAVAVLHLISVNEYRIRPFSRLSANRTTTQRQTTPRVNQTMPFSGLPNCCSFRIEISEKINAVMPRRPKHRIDLRILFDCELTRRTEIAPERMPLHTAQALMRDMRGVFAFTVLHQSSLAFMASGPNHVRMNVQ